MQCINATGLNGKSGGDWGPLLNNFVVSTEA
jgi:hypothetical protein